MVSEVNLKAELEARSREVKLRAACILDKIYLPLESLVLKEKEKPGQNKLFIKELSSLAASLKRESEKLSREALEHGTGTKPI